MPYDEGGSSIRGFPSLVQHCQRVLYAHADGICGVAEGMRWDLIEPILECCSADGLLRIERSSPHIETELSGTWKRLCQRTFPQAVLEMRSHLHEEPESWRDEYYILDELQFKRLEEVGTRLRMQRQEAEERKKESAVKTIDRAPPAKRHRWGGPSQPKSLMQKTREDALRFGLRLKPPARCNPPTPTRSKSLLGQPPASLQPPAPSSSPSVGSRVTVTTVTVRRAPTGPPKRSVSSSVPPGSASSPSIPLPPNTTFKGSAAAQCPSEFVKPPDVQMMPPQRESRLLPSKLVPSAKKDPMSVLFIPKPRAQSQQRIQSISSGGIRSRS